MLACDGAVQQWGLDERQELVNSLRGQQVHIPDLHSLFESWPEATSPHIAALRPKVDRTLNKYEHLGALHERQHPL